MSEYKSTEPTPVDDVRRVRERIDREVQGNIHELVKRSHSAAERYRDALGLKVITPPPHEESREEETA